MTNQTLRIPNPVGRLQTTFTGLYQWVEHSSDAYRRPGNDFGLKIPMLPVLMIVHPQDLLYSFSGDNYQPSFTYFKCYQSYNKLITSKLSRIMVRMIIVTGRSVGVNETKISALQQS